MVSETLRTKGLEQSITHISHKVLVFNVGLGILGFGICSVLGIDVSIRDFATGYLLGTINIFWLLRIARSGMIMEPDNAGRYVTRRYYIRLCVLTLAVLVLISRGITGPWGILAGLTGSVVSTIFVAILMAKGGTR